MAHARLELACALAVLDFVSLVLAELHKAPFRDFAVLNKRVRLCTCVSIKAPILS